MTITMPRKTVTANGVIAAESEVLKQGYIGRKATVFDVVLMAHHQEQNIQLPVCPSPALPLDTFQEPRAFTAVPLPASPKMFSPSLV